MVLQTDQRVNLIKMSSEHSPVVLPILLKEWEQHQNSPLLGSGVLIGPRLVLTCRHVADRYEVGGGWIGPYRTDELIVGESECADIRRSAPVNSAPPAGKEKHPDLALILLKKDMSSAAVPVAFGELHRKVFESAQLVGFHGCVEEPGYCRETVQLSPSFTGLINDRLLSFQNANVSPGMSGGPLLLDYKNEQVCLGIARLGGLGRTKTVVTSGRAIKEFLDSEPVAQFLLSQGLEVSCRFLLQEELLQYLERVKAEAAELPSFYPEELRNLPHGKEGLFHRIRQRVTVVDSREREQWRKREKEELERRKAAGNSVALEIDYDPTPERPKNFNTIDIGGPKAPELLDWDEGSQQERFRQAVILGDPGFGKSWLLRHEAWLLASACEKKIATDGSDELPDDLTIPIRLRLPDLARSKQSSLPLRIKKQLALQMSVTLQTYIMQCVESGRATLLLDSWDEVRQPRESLRKSIASFVMTSQCRILLTSRGAGYDPSHSPLPDKPELQIVAFARPQVEAFVEAWFAPQPGAARKFLSALSRQSSIAGLGRIPLLLSLLCRIFQSTKSELPLRRVEVYQLCLMGLLFDWKQRDKSEQTNGHDRSEIELQIENLARAAGKLFEQKLDQFTNVEFAAAAGFSLKTEAEREQAHAFVQHRKEDGILIAVSTLSSELTGFDRSPTVQFLHRTFFEYLTAYDVAQRVKSDGWESMQRLLTSHLFDPQWQEVIVLVAGELDDPTPLLSYLAEENQDDLFRPKLALAARCLPEISVESWKAFPSLRQLGDQITTTAMDFWRNLAAREIESAAPDVEGSLPALATANRNWGSSPVLTRITADLDSNDAGQLAVLLRYLQQAGSAAGTVGICRQLGRLFLKQGSSLREAALALRALEPDTKSLNVALQILLDIVDGNEAEVRDNAIRAIGALGPMAAKPKVVQALRAALQRDTAPTYVAAHALSELRAAAAYTDIRDVFTTAVKVDIRGPVLTQALMSLTPASDKDSILKMLAEQLTSGDILLDENAARVLSFMRTWANTDYIRQALLNYIVTAIAKHDTYGNMALWNAITALGKLETRASDDAVVNTLLELLQQADPQLRSRAAEALGHQGPRAARKDVVQALLDELQANHPTSSSNAAEALARLRPSEDTKLVVNALVDFVRRLENQSLFVLRDAIEALGTYGPEAAKEPEVVKVLLDHLEHYAGPVREMAAWALGELGTTSATEVVKSALLKELSDAELYPRKAAANSLGRFQRNGIRCEVALIQEQ